MLAEGKLRLTDKISGPFTNPFMADEYPEADEIVTLIKTTQNVFCINLFLDKFMKKQFEELTGLTRDIRPPETLWQEINKLYNLILDVKGLRPNFPQVALYVEDFLEKWLRPMTNLLVIYSSNFYIDKYSGMFDDSTYDGDIEACKYEGQGRINDEIEMSPIMVTNKFDEPKIINFQEAKRSEDDGYECTPKSDCECGEHTNKGLHQASVLGPNSEYLWYRYPSLIKRDTEISGTCEGLRFKEAINAHSNFFDDAGNSWLQYETPGVYNRYVGKHKEKALLKSAFKDFTIENQAKRIAKVDDASVSFGRVTRLSALDCTYIGDSAGKEEILSYLLKYTDYPEALAGVAKISVLTIKYDEKNYKIIEWIFVKDTDQEYRKILFRTLLHIAFTLWKIHKVPVLYPDVIQLQGGFRSTDVRLEKIIP